MLVGGTTLIKVCYQGRVYLKGGLTLALLSFFS